MNYCPCGNLLRGEQARQEGRCLECHITALLEDIALLQQQAQKRAIRKRARLTLTLLATAFGIALCSWMLSVVDKAFTRYLDRIRDFPGPVQEQIEASLLRE